MALPNPAESLGEGLGATALDRLLLFLCVIGPLAAGAVLVGRMFEGRPRPTGGMNPLLAIVLGLLVGGVGLGAALGGAALLGAVSTGAAAPAAAGAAGVLASALLIGFQAGGEELFFRGWLQPLLSARWGPWIGLIVSSVLFAGAHAIAEPMGLLALANITLAGVVFGLLAMRTGGLWAPFAAHWAWNWSEQALAGAVPNPGVDALGSLVDLDLTGPALLSGGADALNGAVSVTVVLALLALGLGLVGAFRREA